MAPPSAVSFVHLNGQAGNAASPRIGAKEPSEVEEAAPGGKGMDDESVHGLEGMKWPEEDVGGRDGGGEWPEVEKKPERPLIRTTNMHTAVITTYRLMIFIRMVTIILFFKWRITQAKNSGIGLIWTVSITGELWFAFLWLLDQLPKLKPVRRIADIVTLNEKYESPYVMINASSNLPGIDVFVTTADPEKEPPLATAATILSILAAGYPVEKLTCYLSDDSGTLLTYEAIAEAAKFATLWVPFCRKHNIEPRNPEAYFGLKRGPYKGTAWPDFVGDRRRVRREYDEFKVRIDALPNVIRRWSEGDGKGDAVRATRMADGTHWPGTWINPSPGHSPGDHAGIVQVLLNPPSHAPQLGGADVPLDFSTVDVRLPALVYMSREKRRGRDHNKKAGAMNALLRASAVLTNGPFILNLDCDHYVNNSQALRAGICFMLDRGGGDNVAFVQFPQRFDGVDPADRYANHNRVFFDATMLALDGLQGPIYVGTGCMFRRVALYGIDPPLWRPDDDVKISGEPKKFGNSTSFVDSTPVAGHQERSDTPQLDKETVAEAVAVVSCASEDRTEWGSSVGWIYGTVTEDVVTGFRMHRRGWRSMYCAMKPDAFRGTAPINLTERLYQVLRWATGSLEIFFSRNNALLAGRRLHLLQRVAYLHTTIYPFTSLFLMVYCLFPVMSFFSGDHAVVVQKPTATFAIYVAVLMAMLVVLAMLEVKWSGITLAEWWRNEQFWMIAGTSAYLAAVLQVTLKLVAGKEISFQLTSKQTTGTDTKDKFADLYIVRWTALMIPPIAVLAVNVVAAAAAIGKAVDVGGWSTMQLGQAVFNVWVLMHLYPFALGLVGQRGKSPVVVFIVSLIVFVSVELIYILPAAASSLFYFPARSLGLDK